jgi:hypothetical protein
MPHTFRNNQIKIVIDILSNPNQQGYHIQIYPDNVDSPPNVVTCMQMCGRKQQPEADCSDQHCWWLWCHGASTDWQFIPATQLQNKL